jgi:hypothetical protein
VAAGEHGLRDRPEAARAVGFEQHDLAGRVAQYGEGIAAKGGECGLVGTAGGFEQFLQHAFADTQAVVAEVQFLVLP